MDSKSPPEIDAVVIGRNEGARLVACLGALAGQVRRIIYVDSGSRDGSPAAARAAGAEVVDLDMSLPFTAARARNAGLAMLSAQDTGYVQLIDGDCTLEPGWIATAAAFLDDQTQVAVACGRRRETDPQGSVYNRLCDHEWNTPVGEAKACGGDALMRLAALRAIDGFRDDLIAGEEPELCVRLRQAGWRIWRLDAPMTRHDANIQRFGQWWQRSRRAGYAFAQGAHLHGAAPVRHWVRESRRALVWGAAVPLVTLGLSVLSATALLILLIYPLQVLRLARRDQPVTRAAWERALFTTLGKFPEAQGVSEFHIDRLLGRRRALVEYKQDTSQR